jgi:hypothetical protein
VGALPEKDRADAPDIRADTPDIRAGTRPAPKTLISNSSGSTK